MPEVQSGARCGPTALVPGRHPVPGILVGRSDGRQLGVTSWLSSGLHRIALTEASSLRIHARQVQGVSRGGAELGKERPLGPAVALAGRVEDVQVAVQRGSVG